MGSSDRKIGMYVIKDNYTMIYINEYAKSAYPHIKTGDKCYKVLGNLDAPCKYCPITNGGKSLFYASYTKQWIEAQAAQIEMDSFGQGYNIQFQIKSSIESSVYNEYEPIDLEEHISDLNMGDGTECIIAGYCEDNYPIFYVNDNFVNLLRYESKKELIKAIDGLVINVIHPDDREQVQNDIGTSYYEGMIYETVYRMPRKDGSWVMIVDKGKVIKTYNGKLALLSICMDMTGFIKRQNELLIRHIQLTERDSLNETILNNMPSGYHRCEAKEGCPFLFIGKQFENIVGYTKEEIKEEFNNLYSNLIWPDDKNVLPTHDDIINMIGKGNSYTTGVYRLKKKGGGYVWVNDSTMFVDLGENSYFHATVSDISSFVEKEHHQQRKLEDAMERIEEANNAKTQFLSSMSHDIRTPMNAIIGMTTLANKHLDDVDYVKNCLKNISLASNHLLTLINDILDISKVESGKMIFNPTVFSLSDTISSVVNILRQQINEKNLKFSVRVHNIKKEYLYADELRLNQIYINILSNAVKYTPDGGSISMDLREELIPNVTDKIRLMYEVEDDGIGMTEEFQSHMYDSFIRAIPNKHGDIQGTGLGLTISKTMVELMGGKIECVSSLGKGSKFTVTLELNVANKSLNDLKLPKINVLLIDEDNIFLDSTAYILKDLGANVYKFNKLDDFINESNNINSNNYDIIFIDLDLSNAKSIDTIKKIRSLVDASTHIIVISSYEWHDIEKMAKNAGADDFISKPFFPSNIYDKVTKVLKIDEYDYNKNNVVDEPDISGMNILVAEDNDINWEIIEEILKLYDISCMRAENGEVCLEILRKSIDYEFDLVLMDIKMPILDGYEATSRIRKSKRDYVKNIPVVAMTADAFSDDVNKCIEAGMNAHISKPIIISNLISVLDSIKNKK